MGWLNADTDKLYREIEKQERIIYRAEYDIKEAKKRIEQYKHELRSLKARADFGMDR